MSEPREVFIEKLMAQILRLTMIPKVQVERAIGPILGLFIEELLSIKWGKRVKMICEEFPLRKAPEKDIQIYQSTNIDWLLYNEDDDQLVFLELKTACTSFDPLQEKRYLQLIVEILKSGSLFLVTDLEKIKGVSLERKKYEELLTRVQKNPRYSVCKKAKLVYLAPSAMRDARPRPLNDGVEWLSFEDLPDKISGELALEWGVIHRNLVELDSKRPRNGTQDGGERRNYGGTSGFEEVMGLCEENGNTIVIGFDGGTGKLRTSSLDELNKRQAFKWDLAEGGTGVKDTRNWIPGQKFLEIVEGLMDD
jgi:hypothetical protein